MLYSLGASPIAFHNFPAHSHDIWEIVLNVQGEGTTMIEGITYPFKPGTIICIPPEQKHTKSSELGFVDIYFHTDSFPLRNSQEAVSTLPIILEDDADKSFESLIRLMLQIYYQDIPEQKGIVNSLYDAAIQLLNSWFVKRHKDPVIEQIQNQIIRTFTDPEMNLTQLLQQSGYSDDYIRKRFREETGMTPKEYLTHLRIGYARQLLSQKELLQLSVSEIGMMCGYYDSHYFSRIFHKKTGMTPKDYIKKLHLVKDVEIIFS